MLVLVIVGRFDFASALQRRSSLSLMFQVRSHAFARILRGEHFPKNALHRIDRIALYTPVSSIRKKAT